MIVICLEGCHGSGKTELLHRFMEVGFEVLDEAFLDMPDYALHPQSLLMETTWVCSWFERLLRKNKELSKSGNRNQIFIADRSPFSAVFYAAHGKLLEPIIRQHIVEVREGAGIEIHTVHVKVERELLWSRIQQRLVREPSRAKYNEDKREWMEKTLDFYHSFQWDLEVHNNEIEISRVRNMLVQRFCLMSPRFVDSLPGPMVSLKRDDGSPEWQVPAKIPRLESVDQVLSTEEASDAPVELVDEILADFGSPVAVPAKRRVLPPSESPTTVTQGASPERVAYAGSLSTPIAVAAAAPASVGESTA